MSEEEFARYWLNKQGLCAIKWDVLEQLCEMYRKNGSKTLVFDPSNKTYFLRENAIAA